MTRSLNPYALDGENQSVYLTLEEVSPEDTREIEKEWQSYWGTGYLEDPRLLRYAAKTTENELGALALPSWGGPERFLISDEVAREHSYEFI